MSCLVALLHCTQPLKEVESHWAAVLRNTQQATIPVAHFALCCALHVLCMPLQEEEEKLAKQTAVGTSAAAAAAAAAEEGVTEAFEADGLEGSAAAALSVAAQQASAAAKRLKAVRDKALAAAKAKQKDILESRRMPMVSMRSGWTQELLLVCSEPQSQQHTCPSLY